MNNAGLMVLAVVLIVLAIVLGPWLIIWSWNTLFGSVYSIEFTFWTWLAVIILGTFFRANVSVKR